MEQMEQNEENEEKSSIDKHENEPKEEKIDRFTELMFGRRRSEEQKETNNQNKEEIPDEVDYFTIVGQVNDIMNSLDDLKPVLKQFSPIIDYIKKKI